MGSGHLHPPAPSGAGVLAAWESRCRLAGVGAWIAALAAVRDPGPAMAGLAVALGFALLSGMGVARLAKRTAPPGAVLLVVAGVFVFFGSDLWLAIGPVRIYRDGVVYGAVVFARALGIFWCAQSVSASGPLSATFQSARSLGFPSPLALIAVTTLRYFPILEEQLATVQTAARCRGFRPATSSRSWRTLAAMGGSVLARAYRKSGRVSQAMACRGFAGDLPWAGKRFPRAGEIALAVASGLAAAGLFLYDQLL